MKTLSKLVPALAGIAVLVLAGFLITDAQTTNPPGIVPLSGTSPLHNQNHYVTVDTNGFIIYPTTLGIGGGPGGFPQVLTLDLVTLTNDAKYYIIEPSNLSTWPTAASQNGGAALVNSNATLYLLQSTPSSTAWAATNKIGQ